MEINKSGKYKCLCCGFFTLDQKPDNTYQICDVCYWEDDSLQTHYPDMGGGANSVSLNQAKENFKKCGASEERFKEYVRKPTKEEMA